MAVRVSTLELLCAPVAGLPHYDYPRLRTALAGDAPLVLKRQPDNRHDRRAIDGPIAEVQMPRRRCMQSVAGELDALERQRLTAPGQRRKGHVIAVLERAAHSSDL